MRPSSIATACAYGSAGSAVKTLAGLGQKGFAEPSRLEQRRIVPGIEDIKHHAVCRIVDFDEIQDVKVTKDMLDLAKHIVNQKAGRFEPAKFEDHYEATLVELINSKRAGKPVTAKARPRGENVVDLMDALRQSIGKASAPPAKPAKKTRKASAGQKEMLMPIQGKGLKAKETTAKKPAPKQRKSA
jgi:hypothetical protein